MRSAPSFLSALVLLATVLAGCTHGSLLGGPGQPGAWGPEFLSADDYASLLVEIDHEPGAAPHQTALNALDSALRRYLDKPSGIEIRTTQIPAQAGTDRSFDQIRTIEDDVRDERKSGTNAVLHILYLNGGSSQDSNDGRVLGAAYTGSSIVMFKGNIDEARQGCPLGLGCPRAGEIEHAVIIHELGHILGLVNNGIPMQTNHEDPQNGGHSSNPESVMYWKVEQADIIDFIIEGKTIPKDFDANDRADMRAAGGK